MTSKRLSELITLTLIMCGQMYLGAYLWAICPYPMRGSWIGSWSCVLTVAISAWALTVTLRDK